MFFNPALHLGRMMDGVTINNEEYFALNLPYDAFEKIQKDARFKAGLEHHEIKVTAVVDRRNHVAGKTLSGARDYWRLTATAVGAPRRMIGAQPHLIAPIYQALFHPGLLLNRRITFLQPLLDRLRALLIGPPNWLLRRETPTSQIPAHRPDREPHAKSLLNQPRYRLSSPQIKREFQLVRVMVCYSLRYLTCLPGKKRT